MESPLKIIASSILAVFLIFFIGRNFTLKRRLKKSIIGDDPFVYSTIFAFTFIVIVFLLTIWDYLHFTSFLTISFIDLAIVKILAIFLLVTATVLCLVSSITLRDSWRVGIPGREKTALIRHGIYAKCRNPYFLAYYIFLVSMFLFSANLFIGLLAIIGIIPLHILVLKEEKHLETQHGESYRQYKNSVRRYWLF